MAGDTQIERDQYLLDQLDEVSGWNQWELKFLDDLLKWLDFRELTDGQRKKAQEMLEKRG